VTSAAATGQHRQWHRHTPRQRLIRFLSYLLFVAVVVWSVGEIDIVWPWFFDAPRAMADLFGRMVPPDFSRMDAIAEALLQTLNIATIATFFAILLALPVAYIAAQNTTPNRACLWLGRFILVSSRSVNTLIWALLFVAIFGPGVLAGILAIAFRSVGFLGKLIGEAIEEIDRKPVEAIEATGASRGKVILYAIVPQVVPTFFAVSILRWDINLRESTVLGLVGAGGIGLLLQSAIDTFQWQVVAAILLAIIALVLLGEAVSGWLRSKVI
jgi:phosphonate transport system permease protein